MLGKQLFVLTFITPLLWNPCSSHHAVLANPLQVLRDDQSKDFVTLHNLI